MTRLEAEMKWNIAASLLTVIALETYSAPPASACGVKLTVKSSAPRKAVAHTSNPSDVLLVGNPPRRLESDLSAAGHRVDVAPTVTAAKHKPYAVVVVDSQQQADEARANFEGATVLVRSGDTVADAHSVEQQVARKPVRTAEARAVVAARPTRTPIAAGPEQAKVVAAAEPRPAQPVTPATPTPAAEPEKVTAAPAPTKPDKPPVAAPAKPEKPEKIATVTQPKPELKTPQPAVEPKPRHDAPAKVAKTDGAHDEVYFTYGSYALDSQMSSALDKAAHWLTENASVHAVVEGHADPSGNHDANLALSQKRAESVRDYLVNAGVDPSRLEVTSFGDTRLKYGRTDRRNRRAAVVPK